jgi:hypothetical protein
MAKNIYDWTGATAILGRNGSSQQSFAALPPDVSVGSKAAIGNRFTARQLCANSGHTFEYLLFSQECSPCIMLA